MCYVSFILSNKVYNIFIFSIVSFVVVVHLYIHVSVRASCGCASILQLINVDVFAIEAAHFPLPGPYPKSKPVFLCSEIQTKTRSTLVLYDP